LGRGADGCVFINQAEDEWFDGTRIADCAEGTGSDFTHVRFRIREERQQRAGDLRVMDAPEKLHGRQTNRASRIVQQAEEEGWGRTVALRQRLNCRQLDDRIAIAEKANGAAGNLVSRTMRPQSNV